MCTNIQTWVRKMIIEVIVPFEGPQLHVVNRAAEAISRAASKLRNIKDRRVFGPRFLWGEDGRIATVTYRVTDMDIDDSTCWTRKTNHKII